MRLLDRTMDALATLAAWVYFAIGLMLAWEVAARYFFTAPTIWAEELSRLFFVYATLLAAPALLRHNQHIRVTAFTGLLGQGGRRACRLIALAIVAAVCVVVVWSGLDAPLRSFDRGRTSGTMLDLPAWWAQAAVPLAFALLGLQAALEWARTALGGPMPDDSAVAE